MSATHPFSEFIAAIGRGPGRSRALSEDEAYRATAMILAGEVAPVQLGAFLMLLRYRRESPPELAGIVRALRESVPAGPERAGVPGAPDIDWPCYATGRTRGLPWFTLSALLLAENGLKPFLHIYHSGGIDRAPAARALQALGIGLASTIQEARRTLEQTGIAAMALGDICADLAGLLDLRPVLGLRSPANSAARMLNPLDAPVQLIGVFHPTYRALHRDAAKALGQPALGVFKGGGGEVERNPAKPCDLFALIGGEPRDITFPAIANRPGADGESALRFAALPALWRGESEDPHATSIVVGTAAIALLIAGRANTPDEADAMAAAMWHERQKERVSRP